MTSNEQLIIRIRAGEDVTGNIARLYEQVRRFIHSIAWKYRSLEEIEDLEQEGFLALYDAIDGYDPAAGCKFLTYAEYWIKQRIQRYVENNCSCVRVPVYTRQRIRKYKKFCDTFQKSQGREPTDSEIRYYMQLSREQTEQLKADLNTGSVLSLDTPIAGADDDSLTLADTVKSDTDVEDQTVEWMNGEQLKREVWACVDALEERQTDVIRKRYQGEMTLGAIGKEYEVTPESVRQIHAKALRELRKPRYSKRLRPFLEERERIYGMALVGGGAERFNHSWTSSTEWAALKIMEG